MKIYQEKISDKHNSSFWYDGTIAEHNGMTLMAVGEIRINSQNGTVYDVKERNEGIDGGLENDDDLNKIGDEFTDKYYWVHNNWFEVIETGEIEYEYDEAIEMLRNSVLS